jgi:hypothetical protein
MLGILPMPPPSRLGTLSQGCGECEDEKKKAAHDFPID